MRTVLNISIFLAFSFFVVQFPMVLLAQQRSLEQNPGLNNLIHGSDTRTVDWGELGEIIKMGTGPKKMIFISGLGFSSETYNEFLEAYHANYTIYVVTLPGFGGTAPLPIHREQPDFAETPWINSAIRGIEDLIKKENIKKSLLVAHWAVASQIAIKLAVKHPEKFDKTILISGVAKSYFESIPEMLSWNLGQREEYVNALASKWFNTVTKKTWYDNNYMPYDYAVNPLRGLFLWRDTAQASLTVQIRYMLEFYSMDVFTEIENLKIPILVIQPGFNDEGFYLDPERPNYMKNLTLDSWKGINHEFITFKKIDHSRLFIMYDKPAILKSIIEQFVN